MGACAERVPIPRPEKLPLDLSTFADVGDYPGWFEYKLPNGNLAKTTAFEDRFRRLAPHHLEAWYEVVYWKNYSQPRSRNRTTQGIINEVEKAGITANVLWVLCGWYMASNNPLGLSDHEMFSVFWKMLIKGDGVATAATFPAFIDPDNFPMVDIWIARWAKANGSRYSYAQFGGPDLVTHAGLGDHLLTDKDWYCATWIDWCRFTAKILTERSGKWRARDDGNLHGAKERRSHNAKPALRLATP